MCQAYVAGLKASIVRKQVPRSGWNLSVENQMGPHLNTLCLVAPLKKL